MNHLPVGLKCYMMRPGNGRLEGITLEKDGLFSVAARKNLHPRHLLHYYNAHLVGQRDAAIYNPLDFLFVAKGGLCEGDSLRSILGYRWTPAQFALVGRSVDAFPTATAEAVATTATAEAVATTVAASAVATTVAATSFAPNPYSSIQPIKLDVASVMAATVETFSTSAACKKLLDSCGGFEELRPRVCAHLDPCCIQATVLDLEDEVHWIMLAGKEVAIWDELRAIQKHMKALRELCE